jgi:hypothetical protein
MVEAFLVVVVFAATVGVAYGMNKGVLALLLRAMRGGETAP